MKIFVLFLLRLTGVFWIARYLCRNNIIIFSLHGVMDEEEHSDWKPLRSQISRRSFDETLSVLSNYYNFISLDEAVSMLNGSRKVKPYCIVLTFDDGYRNNITHALPILQKYSAPATFFLATGYVDKKKPYWFDRLDYALQFGGVNGMNVSVAGNSIIIDSSSRAALIQTYSEIRRTSKKANRNDYEMVSEMENIAAEIEKKSGNKLEDIFDNDPWSSVLTWEEVKAFSKVEGVTFGSHTVEHVRLSLVDEDTISNEIVNSKYSIEKQTGKKCQHFCYPIGSFNNEVSEMIKNTGYLSAVTTVNRMNHSGADLMKLGRFSFPADRHPLQILAVTCNLTQVFLRIKACLKGHCT